MSDYYSTVSWQRAENEVFVDNKYNRAHQWSFDGGLTVPASPSPHIVPLPYSNEANVDPEEAFVASLSSCHMLFFLSIVAAKKIVVDSYVDKAVGTMETDSAGCTSITLVTLRPEIQFSGSTNPTPEQLKDWHHLAHQQCFIANSVKSKVVTEIL